MKDGANNMYEEYGIKIERSDMDICCNCYKKGNKGYCDIYYHHDWITTLCKDCTDDMIKQIKELEGE